MVANGLFQQRQGDAACLQSPGSRPQTRQFHQRHAEITRNFRIAQVELLLTEGQEGSASGLAESAGAWLFRPPENAMIREGHVIHIRRPRRHMAGQAIVGRERFLPCRR